jgi:hypothetical protein
VKAGRIQCKDIPDEPILRLLDNLTGELPWAFRWESGVTNSVMEAMPPGVPENLVLAKMKSLIRKGLVSGCCCGCRGDFEITQKGIDWLVRSPVSSPVSSGAPSGP